MLKFTIQNDKVCLDPNIILIDEFHNIVRFGKKQNDEDLSNRMLIYVFYCCDLSEDNPMRDIDYREKEDQALARAFQNKKKKFTVDERKLIDGAINAYNYFNETSAERAILAIDQKIDQARTTLEEQDVEIVRNTNPNTGVVTFTSNENILSNLAKQIGELMTLKLQVTNAAKKLENNGRVRANKGSSLLERSAMLTRKSPGE